MLSIQTSPLPDVYRHCPSHHSTCPDQDSFFHFHLKKKQWHLHFLSVPTAYTNNSFEVKICELSESVHETHVTTSVSHNGVQCLSGLEVLGSCSGRMEPLWGKTKTWEAHAVTSSGTLEEIMRTKEQSAWRWLKGTKETSEACVFAQGWVPSIRLHRTKWVMEGVAPSWNQHN